jgi:hypothetical protein
VSDAVERAVNRLLYAGMVLRYRSAYGHSFYLGWPGRRGVLRVSDHPSQEHNISPLIYGSLTLHEQSTPLSEEGLTKRIAEALGRYLLKAPATEGDCENHGE